MVVVGQTFSGIPEDEFLTPFMPRQGNGVTTTFEVLALSPETKLTVGMLHKNSEDTGDGTALSTVSGTDNLSAIGVASFRCSGIKELVRYRLKLDFTGDPPPAGVSLWAHYRFLFPAWEISGAQSI